MGPHARTVILLVAASTVMANPSFAQRRERHDGDEHGRRSVERAQPRGSGESQRRQDRPRGNEDRPRGNRLFGDRPDSGRSQERVQPYRGDDRRRQEGRRDDGRTFDNRPDNRSFRERSDSRQFPRALERDPRSDSGRYDNRPYNNRPYSNNRSYDNRSYDNRSYDNRSYNNRSYNNRSYNNRSYGYRSYGYPSYGYRSGRRSYALPFGYRPGGYRPGWSLNLYFGRPYGVYGYPGYGYPSAGYGYYSFIPGRLYGAVRIVDAPRDAQVLVDGYYAGVVDDYDGVFQHLNLEAGPHHIEIEVDGYPPIGFDVQVIPGQTITCRANIF